jgi:polysaccharide biosynthesis transport protein
MDCKQQNDVQRNCANPSHHEQNGACVASFDATLSAVEIGQTLRAHARWWVIPAVICTVLAGAYSLIAPRNWRATQSLIVRPETNVSDVHLGKFSDLSEMKTLQETILELAKSQGVIETTLAQLGPPNGVKANWPTARDVEEFRDQIDMRPPGGAEFGKTEVFYLSVHDSDRARASRALVILCGALEKRLQGLRDERAKGMIAELQEAATLAERDLASRTAELAKFEAAIGPELVELRNLNATAGGQGEISQQLQAIESERRSNEASRRENARLLEVLEAAGDNPTKLLATPNSLLRSQPSVNQLKNALVEAQIRTANLLSGRTERHPFVVAARASEASLRGQLNAEVAVAIENLKIEIALNEDREESLLANWLEARARISKLAESRAEYSNLVAAADNYTRQVEAARKNLSDARARQAAAHTASVIGRIDGVEAGVRPVGPSRKTIVAAGGVGGLIFGFGLVFLFATPAGRGTEKTQTAGNARAGVCDRGNGESSVNYRTLQSSDLKPANTPYEEFGMFKGMTLEQAIRSVNGAVSRGRV